MSPGIYGPPWRIDGPPPEPPPYTLLGAARVVDDVDAGQVDRWANSVAVYPYPTGIGVVWDACAVASELEAKPAGPVVPLPQFGAMVVVVAETCTAMGIYGQGISSEEAQRRFVARALAVLQAVESATVEREFLRGTVLGNNPHLADGNGTFPWLNAVTSVANGLAVLEDEIAASGRRGLLHVTPGVAVAADTRILRDDRAGLLRTINGTVVVPGYGYADGPAPDGHTAPGATEDWIYATGPVEVRRSEPIVVPGELSQALDRDVNTITYRVERYYAVDWDTAVQAAVRVDRCTTTCGSPA